jgi:hypothetical protein
MGRWSAVASGAAFFLIAMFSGPLAAQTCEDCAARKVVRLDVTAAVDTAISLVATTLRKLRPSYEVTIVEADAPQVPEPTLTVAEYAAAYDAGDGQIQAELPGLQHRYAWELTYRDDGVDHASQLSKFARFRDTDVTLDDTWVFGLRFEWDYGWKR